MKVFLAIANDVSTVWEAFTAQNQSSPAGSTPRNPGDIFWEKSIKVWRRIKGLYLEGYEQQLLDVHALLPDTTPWELELDFVYLVKV